MVIGHVKDQSSLLEIRGLSKRFGGLMAVNALDMVVKQGEILALIGPNGAGKTTVFNLITGFLSPTQGELFFKGENITKLKPHRIARKGVVRSFQDNVLFMEKTVKENVLLGFHSKRGYGFINELFNTGSFRRERNKMEQKAEKILEFLKIHVLKEQLAKNLAHGHQRALGIAISWASNPKLLLLDEPLTGMTDEERATMIALIKGIRDTGVTILLVEHDMKSVMGNCDRIVAIEYGTKIAEGEPNEIANNPKVIEAYLGSGEYCAS